MEVDCPCLSERASVDVHIDLIEARFQGKVPCYLHSSPEYPMKRLLAQGIGDIYQLSHVFRDGEVGKKHNPEFMMAEWYRVGFSFDQLIAETLDFVRLFLGPLPGAVLSYRETLQKYTGIDYVHAAEKELKAYLLARDIPLYDGIEQEGKDAYLNLLLAHFVEPHLGRGELFVLSHYPSTQAALAKTIQRGDESAAERMEIYYQGVELANGYHELADADEQQARLEEANHERLQRGKNALPIDHNFLQALRQGLPDCCGVAVGFDRLMMLKLGASDLHSVMPFTWSNS